MRKKVDFREMGLQMVAHQCRGSFFYFVQTFWGEIIKEAPSYNWHIPYLCEELQALSVSIVERSTKPYDLIVNIPPGTTKSTITTIMYPAWLWVLDPSIRVITNSYSMDLSIEHAIKSRDIITSEKYQRLFPHIVLRRDKAAKSSYENTSTGARYTTSTGGTITGKHAHIIINDDPLNPSQAASDADRNSANEHTKTLASRKVNKENTPTITIMQRLHESDVTGYILEKKSDKIRHLCLPATLSEMVKPPELEQRYIGGLLDPVRLSQAVLDEQLIDLGSRGFAGQYQQNPVADGGNIVKKEWFGYISAVEFARKRDRQPMVFFLDTAFKEESHSGKNDPSGIIASCRIGNDLYIRYAEKQYLKFPDLIRFIPEFVAQHGYRESSSIHIEPKANGISVVHQLKEFTRLNVKEIDSPIIRESKMTRLTSVSPKIECGRVFLVDGGWNEAFVDEICGFPAKAHDEYVDLISYAIDYHLKAQYEEQDLSGLFDILY